MNSFSNKIQKFFSPDNKSPIYGYWRLRIFYSMYIGYAFFYITRKSFIFAMPLMMEDLGFTKGELGFLGTVLYLMYGVSKFCSGIISDRSNPRYFMSCGLILTGIANILFGFSSTLLCFAVFWGVNGWFQGWGWPPCARLLTHWYAKEERGRWWSVWNTCHNLGGALCPIIVLALATHFNWRIAMYVPGIVCILCGLFLMNRLRDTPESLGLSPIEPDNEAGLVAQQSFKEILVQYVLKNYYIWTVSIAYFFVYVIRVAVNDWGHLYFYEQGFSLYHAGLTVALFEIGGFFGSLVAGWMSDKKFGGKRGPVNILFTLGTMASLLLLTVVPAQYFYANTVMFLIGFFIFGPQMLIGMVAAELSHKKAAGTATGFAGCFAYAGAACAGYPCGVICEQYGWSGFMALLVMCSAAALMLLIPLWTVHQRPIPATSK